jgi:dTDP-4-dehydrorhamnose reductase
MSSKGWAAGPVLILGAKGMLAHDLVPAMRRRLGTSLADPLHAWDSRRLDIRNERAVREALRALRPTTVINSAAYTDVDACESNVEHAMAVNAVGPGNIARSCREIDSLLIHFGTDYVFDGHGNRPHRPADPAGPLSVYGRSKWEGEQAIQAAGCRHLILRTSWLFGPGRRNFVERILENAGQGGTLRVVADQVGRPTLAADLSDAIIRLLDSGSEGVLHFANDGACSWFEFARSILTHAGLDVPINPIASSQLARPARRPTNSVLDLSDYVQATGHSPPPWPDALRRYFEAKRAAIAQLPNSATATPA